MRRTLFTLATAVSVALFMLVVCATADGDPFPRFAVGRVFWVEFDKSAVAIKVPAGSGLRTVFRLHYLWVGVLTSILPLYPVYRRLREGYEGAARKRPAAAGRCPRCGHDLRATPDHCPECGTVPTRSQG